MASIDPTRPVPAVLTPTRVRPVAASGWERTYVTTLVLLDVGVALIAASVAFLIRFGDVQALRPWYVALTLGFPMLWVGGLYLARAYEPRFLFVGSEEYHRVMLTGLSLMALIAFTSYATKVEIARGYVLLVLPIATATDLVVRYSARRRLQQLRERGHCQRRVVLVGYERAVATMCRRLRLERYHGMEVVGACLPPHRPLRSSIKDVGVTVLGTFDDVADVVQDIEADTVAVLACPELDAEVLRRLAWRLEETRTSLLVAPALMDVAGPRTTIRPVDGLPLLHVDHPELSGGRRAMKALFDATSSFAALVLLSPLLLAIAVLIRLGDGGPAIFTQERVGKDGIPFKLYKFRTMHVDAEQRLADLLALNEHHEGVLFKIREDPRVTRVGRWLRKYSLDELPQLFNVLLGDMSLVGPRPPLAREVAMYEEHVRRRLVVKPGITGLWQVSGRADLSWEESVRLDLRYVENWSLAFDLRIIWRTFAAIIHSSGAY